MGHSWRWPHDARSATAKHNTQHHSGDAARKFRKISLPPLRKATQSSMTPPSDPSSGGVSGVLDGEVFNGEALRGEGLSGDSKLSSIR